MSVAIVDYGSGNLHSAVKAFERAAREGGAGTAVALTADPDIVRRADRVVLPGVGAFADCKRGLEAVPGMIEALDEAVHRRGRPFLGICVGMQLLATTGLEHGASPGLGWIDGEVGPIAPADPSMKIPHMGWNTLDLAPGSSHALLAGIPTGADGWHAYFVHSYGFRATHAADVVASVDYGGTIAAVVGRGTVAGTQFHPEKSQALGLALIANFLEWTP